MLFFPFRNTYDLFNDIPRETDIAAGTETYAPTLNAQINTLASEFVTQSYKLNEFLIADVNIPKALANVSSSASGSHSNKLF